MLILISNSISVIAALPSATIDVYEIKEEENHSECLSSNFLNCLTHTRSFDASRASFSQPLHFDKPNGFDYNYRPKPLVAAPIYDPLLCNIHYPNLASPTSFSSSLTDIYEQKIVLVPRGQCDFERKALNAQLLGADGVVIYNTLESRYNVNETNGIVWPNERDYECDNGETW